MIPVSSLFEGFNHYPGNSVTDSSIWHSLNDHDSDISKHYLAVVYFLAFVIFTVRISVKNFLFRKGLELFILLIYLEIGINRSVKSCCNSLFMDLDCLFKDLNLFVCKNSEFKLVFAATRTLRLYNQHLLSLTCAWHDRLDVDIIDSVQSWIIVINTDG